MIIYKVYCYNWKSYKSLIIIFYSTNYLFAWTEIRNQQKLKILKKKLNWLIIFEVFLIELIS